MELLLGILSGLTITANTLKVNLSSPQAICNQQAIARVARKARGKEEKR